MSNSHRATRSIRKHRTAQLSIHAEIMVSYAPPLCKGAVDEYPRSSSKTAFVRFSKIFSKHLKTAGHDVASTCPIKTKVIFCLANYENAVQRRRQNVVAFPIRTTGSSRIRAKDWGAWEGCALHQRRVTLSQFDLGNDNDRQNESGEVANGRWRKDREWKSDWKEDEHKCDSTQNQAQSYHRKPTFLTTHCQFYLQESSFYHVSNSLSKGMDFIHCICWHSDQLSTWTTFMASRIRQRATAGKSHSHFRNIYPTTLSNIIPRLQMAHVATWFAVGHDLLMRRANDLLTRAFVP
jgi:hypothetical protein